MNKLLQGEKKRKGEEAGCIGFVDVFCFFPSELSFLSTWSKVFYYLHLNFISVTNIFLCKLT